jgi:hypothetical protein
MNVAQGTELIQTQITSHVLLSLSPRKIVPILQKWRVSHII